MSSESVSLPEFLLARIAEDEAACDDSAGWWEHRFAVPRRRMSAECEARRLIVDSVGYHLELSGDVTPASDELAEITLRALALPYADHPDYDEGWRP